MTPKRKRELLEMVKHWRPNEPVQSDDFAEASIKRLTYMELRELLTDKVCEFSVDHQTQCGHYWAGSPATFCPYCGGKVVTRG